LGEQRHIVRVRLLASEDIASWLVAALDVPAPWLRDGWPAIVSEPAARRTRPAVEPAARGA